MMDKDVILGLASLLVVALYIVDKVANQRTVQSLTGAIKDTASDTQLVQLAHSMAVKVVSVDVLNQALAAITKGADFVKVLTPDEIDAAIEAGVDLAGAVASGKPVTSNDVVKAINASATITV